MAGKAKSNPEKPKRAAKPATSKTAAKKATAKKAVAKRPAVKKAPAKRPAAKKAPAKKPVAKKAPAKKSIAKKPVAKKAPAKKSVAKEPVAKKAPARKKSAAVSDTAPTPKGVRRRDAGGRVDPQYQAELLAKSGHNRDDRDAHAFLDRPESDDSVVEGLGETFLQNVTSGIERDEEAETDPNAPDEAGGPYVVTSAKEEFAQGLDESNPEDAEPAPFPITQSES